MRVVFLQERAASAAATSDDPGDVGEKKKLGDSGESKGPAAGEGATAMKRKEALTAEFETRLEMDRATVESGIRARDARNRLI